MPVEITGVRYLSPKIGSFIRAASPMDEEKLAEVPPNKCIAIRIEVAVPIKLKNFYWGLVSKLVQAGVYEARDAAHVSLMVRAGRVSHIRISGSITELVPVSTKEWDAIEWRQFMDALLPILTTEIIPGIRFADLRREVERYVGIQFTDAMKEGT